MNEELKFEVVECLVGWAVSCQVKVREDWRKYRAALESGFLVGFWRETVRSDISDLRQARKVLKEF